MELSDAHVTTHRFNLDPTINLGHLISIVLTLSAIVAGYVTMDSRVSALEHQQLAMAATLKESVSATEARTTLRMSDEHARVDTIVARTSDDIREVKQIVRDGFRDLDQKLDRKVDKPGR